MNLGSLVFCTAEMVWFVGRSSVAQVYLTSI